MFNSIGKPIAPMLIMGIIAMGLGSLLSVALGPDVVVVAGLLSLAGIVLAVIGAARLADAVQYLAIRERDREHAVD